MRNYSMNEGIHLRSVTKNSFGTFPNTFPFNVPIIKALTTLEFETQVTFFVGENGCGKSTLIEAIACAVGSITVGSDSVETDRTLSPLRTLGKTIKLVWSKKTRRGFFMRSEDFFGYARKMAATREELRENLDNVEREYADKSEFTKQYARAAYQNQLGAISQYYGDDVDARSHGESYLNLFQSRFVPEGLYLLDEPEAPLSPLRQLSFLAILKSMVDQKSQFIIATHSPIIMAYPDATILNLDESGIKKVNYQDVEHVRITKDFLVNPKPYFKTLFE
jgi:predicted ATPase